MGNSEKNTESFVHTVIRTIITTTIIAAILYGVHVFPSSGKSKLVLFEMIWSVVFCIVFCGHWLELLFINRIKFYLPQNMLSLYFIRIVFAANLIADLFSARTVQMGRWWMFGFFYIGIQLLMHAIMQVRFKKSFYNGVY
jgi:hypothetical protein